MERRPIPPGYELIFRPFITRNGRRIPPPRGRKAWALLVRKDRRED